MDDSYRTPRGLALINSPFFKILIKLEKISLLGNVDITLNNIANGMQGMHFLQASRKNIRNLGRGVPNFKSHDFSKATNFISFNSSKALSSFRAGP